MSEQEAWQQFNEAMEGLKQVHTREALESQKKKVHKAREELIKLSPEFRQMLMRKKAEAEEKAETRRLQMELKTQVYMQQVETVRTKAEGFRRQADSMVSRFPTIMKPFGGMTKMPLPDDDVEILVCPKCLTRYVNWLKVNRKTARKEKLPKGVREIPWCFRCKKRMVRMARKEVNKKKREKMKDKLEMKK
ncbi:hypothetical protein ES702_01401 [subsurface metagenome]